MGIVKKIKRISFLFFLCIIVIGIYIWLYHPFLDYNRTAHISIDDVTKSFQNLCKDSNKYNSIFEEPFFAYLKHLHDDYSCAITCYVFERDGDFDISQFPQKYSDEFKNNSTWLKFGFHGITLSKHVPNNVSFNNFVGSFCRFNRELSRFASEESKANIIRLDYYYATTKEVEFLVKHGVTTLLSSHDDRRSYHLPFAKNNQLITQNSIQYNGLKYLRTNIRIENIDFPYFNILRNRDKDTLVIFTHEWKLDKINKYKLEKTIKILSEKNYRFICE